MNDQKQFTSGFLFSTPSFLSGAGTVINLAGNYYKFNSSNSGTEADELAIEHDFRMIGQDIKNAFDLLKRKGEK
jgi:hypothetical protein